jgi:hypothetical protein
MGHVQTMVRALIKLPSWSLVPSRADLLPVGREPTGRREYAVETYPELLARTQRSAASEAGIEVTDSIPIDDIGDTTESTRLPPWVSSALRIRSSAKPLSAKDPCIRTLPSSRDAQMGATEGPALALAQPERTLARSAVLPVSSISDQTGYPPGCAT